MHLLFLGEKKTCCKRNSKLIKTVALDIANELPATKSTPRRSFSHHKLLYFVLVRRQENFKIYDRYSNMESYPSANGNFIIQ